MDNLKEKTANGLWWAAMSNGAQQLVMLLIGIVLARILSVEDYGLVAMLTAFCCSPRTCRRAVSPPRSV